MSSSTTPQTYDVFRASMNALASYIATQITSTGGPVTTNSVLSLIQNYIATRGETAIPLTNISVDYETNLAEIQSVLGTQSSWIDAQNTATGQRIIQMIATALTFMQFSIVRSAQEAVMPTAIIDNSIFANTLHLGVRIYRRIPAGMTVQLFNSGPAATIVVIPAYSAFSISGYNLFNRNIITFPANTASLVETLYEGQVQTLNVTSDGSNNLIYKFGSSDFSISDIDTTVTVNGIAWSRTVFNQYFNIGLWEYGPNDQVFQDSTTSDGNVEVQFGNNITGAVPPSAAAIGITYVQTNGQEANVNLTGSTISYTANSNITGVALTALQNGTDNQPASNYKTLGPGLFAAKYRAVARPDCAAIARTYPGVIDALFQGQQELYPSDLRYMMYQQATLLTQSTWSSQQITDFITWFNNLNIANTVLNVQMATAITENVIANVYCVNLANQAAIQNTLINTTQTFFTPRPGILGYNVMVNDLEYLLKNANPQQIDYIDLLAPTADSSITATEYVALGTLTLNMFTSNRNTIS